MAAIPPIAPDVQYQQIRSSIQTGDILLFRGRRRLSRVIEWISGSPYSHVAFLTKWEGRIIAMQSDLRGVEVIPASMLVCQYPGLVEWWRLKPEHRKHLDERDFLNRALTLIGIRYGYLQLLWVALRMLLHLPLRSRHAHLRPSTLFCSSFVSYCYDNEHIAISTRSGVEETSPCDFAHSGIFDQPQQLFDGSDSKACDRLLETRLGKEKTGRAQQKGSVWTGLDRRAPKSRAPASVAPPGTSPGAPPPAAPPVIETL